VCWGGGIRQPSGTSCSTPIGYREALLGGPLKRRLDACSLAVPLPEKEGRSRPASLMLIADTEQGAGPAGRGIIPGARRPAALRVPVCHAGMDGGLATAWVWLPRTGLRPMARSTPGRPLLAPVRTVSARDYKPGRRR